MVPDRSRPTAGVTAGMASGHGQAPNDDQVSRRVQKKCWNCGQTGHLSANCSKPHKESSGNHGNVRANMVGTGPIESLLEDPLSYLLSDSDSDSGGISKIRVEDKGSIPRRTEVLAGGVPLQGVIDTAVDITIMDAESFKKVAMTCRLQKKDYKPADKTPFNYDRKTFHLDGRIENYHLY